MTGLTAASVDPWPQRSPKHPSIPGSSLTAFFDPFRDVTFHVEGAPRRTATVALTRVDHTIILPLLVHIGVAQARHIDITIGIEPTEHTPTGLGPLVLCAETATTDLASNPCLYPGHVRQGPKPLPWELVALDTVALSAELTPRSGISDDVGLIVRKLDLIACSSAEKCSRRHIAHVLGTEHSLTRAHRNVAPIASG